MKKSIIRIISILLLVSVICAPLLAHAEGEKQGGNVTSKSLAMRHNPHSKSATKKTLQNGEYVEVLAVDGAWAKVNHYGDTGYVAAAYLKFGAATERLSAPTGISASVSGSIVKVSWKAIGGVNKYLVYGSTDGKSYTRLTSVTTNNATLDELTTGKQYTFKVAAVRSNNQIGILSGASKAVTAPKQVAKLAAPTGLEVQTASNPEYLRANFVSGATSYIMEKSTISATEGFVRVETIEGDYLAGQIQYRGRLLFDIAYHRLDYTAWFRVAAVDKNGVVGKYSEVVKVVFPVPPKPQNVKIELAPKYNAINISWDRIDSKYLKTTGKYPVDRMKVYISEDGKNFRYFDMTSSQQSANTAEREDISTNCMISVVNRELKPDTPYYFKVCLAYGHTSKIDDKGNRIPTGEYAFSDVFSISVPEIYTNRALGGTREAALEMIRLANIERAKRGLVPLELDEDLMSAAKIRSEEMTRRFSHTRPDGSSWSTVHPKVLSEIITQSGGNPASDINGWMESKGHRDSMLMPNHTTAGAAFGVMLFGGEPIHTDYVSVNGVLYEIVNGEYIRVE